MKEMGPLDLERTSLSHCIIRPVWVISPGVRKHNGTMRLMAPSLIVIADNASGRNWRSDGTALNWDSLQNSLELDAGLRKYSPYGQ